MGGGGGYAIKIYAMNLLIPCSSYRVLYSTAPDRAPVVPESPRAKRLALGRFRRFSPCSRLLAYFCSMCGAGTIPCLGAGWFPDVLFVGGEADESAVDYLKQNRDPRRRLRPPPEATTSGAACAAACAWDAQLLPLRDGTVDAMVVDM